MNEVKTIRRWSAFVTAIEKRNDLQEWVEKVEASYGRRENKILLLLNRMTHLMVKIDLERNPYPKGRWVIK